MQETFHILVFRGEISPGCDPQEVRSKLCVLLKTDAARVESMFDGRTTVLKNNLRLPDAEKIKRMFDATGAVSIIEPVEDNAPSAAVSPPPVPPQHPLSHPDAPIVSRSRPVGVSVAAPATRTGIMPGSRGHLVVTALTVLIGIAMLGSGLFKAVQTAKFVNTSLTATGRVTGFAASRGGGSRSTTYAPEVGFRAPSGRMIRFRSQLSSNIVSYRTGDDVAVRYDPADPHHAEIDAFMPLWGVSTILLVIGALFSAFGCRMLGIRRHAKTVDYGRASWTGAKGEQITCPVCGLRQPVTDSCGACGFNMSRMQEQMARVRRFSAWMSGKSAALRIGVIAVSVTFGIASFALHWRSLASSGGSELTHPVIWSDPDNRYEFSIPVDWQPRSTKDVDSTFPMLQREPPAMYQLVASSKPFPDTVLALGISGIATERIRSAGWDGIAAEIGNGNRIEFSDVVQFNGLTVHRFGYGVAGGYREDAYFEADKHVILVCFAVAAGNNLAGQVARTRNLIMSSLSGT